MPRPGTTTTIRTRRGRSGVLSSTSTAFVVGLADRGPTDVPVPIRSMAEFETWFGTRQSYSVLWDSVDVLLRLGRSVVYVMRVVGPAATKASVSLAGAADALSIDVKGKGEGTMTGWTVQPVAGDAGGTIRLVLFLNGVEVTRSYDAATVQDLVTWSTQVPYVDVVATGVVLPVAGAAVAIAGGNDQRASITDTERSAALAKIPKSLGPGQVLAPGVTTTATHAALAVHARQNNRFALWDGPDSSSDTTHKANVDAIRASAAIAEGDETYGMYLAPWVIIPGLVKNTTRTVPPSAVAAGVIAASDQDTQNPNIAAAGDSGIAAYALGLTQPEWSDSVREAMNLKGVNLFRVIDGQVRLYGFRSAASPDDADWSGWVQATTGRFRMVLTTQADRLGERFVFDQIDGKGRKAAEFGGAIRGELLAWYDDDALFGETPDEAFDVDTGPNVNTPDTAADGRLRASIGFRNSPFAELVEFDYVQTPANQPL